MEFSQHGYESLHITSSQKPPIDEINLLSCVANYYEYNFLAAFQTGGRWPWLFFASITHGFVVEMLSYFAPFIENFWHAQGFITLFDRRMALYIAILCMYTFVFINRRRNHIH